MPILWLGVCGSALAFEVFEGLQVHGFLTQGYFLTSNNNNFFGESTDGGSLGFTEIGVNASWLPRPDVQLAIQGLSRRAGGASEGEPELDFALLDYAAIETADRRLGVRVGRVRLPFGLYNDTRDVAFTRPSILLPQSIYNERTRELQISGDGILFYAEERSTWGNLVLELGPALARVDNENSELALLGRDFPGDLESRWSFIGRVMYWTPREALRLAITGVRLETDYNPKLAFPDDLGPGKDLFEPVIFSAQYNAESWSLTGEYARRPIKHEGFLVPGFDFDIVGESYYIQGIYRIDPHWEMVVRYDVLYSDVDDRDGSKTEAATGIPSSFQFAKDWTVGVRYNITPSWMARAEYHNVYGGTLYLFPQDNPDTFALNKKWDIFALLLSYRF
ncbi:MAG: hypothetical protein ACREA0_04680 [bacterium]